MPYVPIPDGTEGDDAPHLTSADEYYDAKGGNDTIDPGSGTDYIIGGPGNDTLQLNWHVYVSGIGSAGVSALTSNPGGGYDGQFRAPGYAQVQFVSIENFIIDATQTADYVVVGGGNDQIMLNEGDDWVKLGLGVDHAWGGAGNDGYGKDFSDQTTGVTINLVNGDRFNVNTVDGFEYFYDITGGSGNDTFLSTQVQYNDLIDGGAGNDLLGAGFSAVNGVDIVHGGPGSDRLIFDWNVYISGMVTTIAPDGAGGYTGNYNAANGYTKVEFDGIEHFTITGTQTDDVITTGDGDDIVNASSGEDIVHLGKGVDQAEGGAGNDGYGKDFTQYSGVTVDLNTNTVTGAGGNTESGFEYFAGITGGSGNDTFLSTQVQINDLIDGGDGDDLLGPGFSAVGGADVVHGGDGNDTLVFDWNVYISGMTSTLVADADGSYHGSYIAAGGYTRVDFDGIENVHITGTQTNDVIITGDGNDIVNAGSGEDIVHLGKGIDQAEGGAGNDGYGKDFTQYSGVTVDLNTNTVTGAGGNTENGFEYFSGITGGVGNDTFLSTQAQINDLIDGGAGDDLLGAGFSAVGGADVVHGGTGNDTLTIDWNVYISGMASTLIADGGGSYHGSYDAAGGYSHVDFDGIENFHITGTQTDDTIVTGDGNDIVNASSGQDVTHLGKGVDQAEGGAGTDGYGKDFSQYSGVTVDLGAGTVTGAGGNTATGFEYFDGVRGGAGNDTFLSTQVQANDLIDGGDGNDILGSGFSVVGGADTVHGGAGNDTLTIDWNVYISGISSTLIADGGGSYHGSYDAGNGYTHVDFDGIENVHITGTQTDDTVRAGDGNDWFDGSIGTDTFVLTGNAADYEFYAGASGALLVKDKHQAWGHGLDTLFSVEKLQFADGTVNTSGLTLTPMPPAPPPPPPANHAPTGSATASLAHGSEDTAYIVSAASLLQGFSDADGDTLSVTGLTANHGSVTNNGNGTFTITPAANYNGAVALSYTVSDGNGGTIAASQTVVLDAVNDTPTGAATAILAHGTEDTGYVVSAATLLQGFSDIDGDTLSVTGLSSDHGAVANNGDGTFTLTPVANYNGPVVLTYTVSDGHGGLVPGSRTVTLDAVNDTPTGVATASLAHGSEDTAYVVSAATLLQGFSDIDGDSLSVTGLTTNHGSVVNNGNGTFTITPAANYNGSVALSYTVSDGHGGTIAASQSLILDPVNDAPVAVNDTATTAQNSAVTIPVATLLANDSDLDGHSLALTAVNGAVQGTVSLNGGNVVFTPASGYSGPASFGYDISDGHGGTAHGTVNVTIVAPSTPASQYVRLSEGADTVSYATATAKLTIAALGGNDTIYGSAFDDSINGGAGNDTLSGGGGKDVLTGGTGTDVVTGGAGSDSFVFNAGDLRATADPSSAWGFDRIGDFEGAGLPTSAAAPQDLIQFFGFGAGSTLTFDHYGASQAEQYYVLHDPTKAANDGYILVAMATGTAKLTAGDYHFY